MKTLVKNDKADNKQPKIDSSVKIDSRLDKIKDIKFTSDKLEEVNKKEFKLSL